MLCFVGFRVRTRVVLCNVLIGLGLGRVLVTAKIQHKDCGIGHESVVLCWVGHCSRGVV